MSGRPKALLVLSQHEHARLEALAARSSVSPAVGLRARIVLACARGADNKTVAAALRVTPQTVSKWRARFVSLRLDGLADAPRPGAPHSIDDARIDAVVARTLAPPPAGAPRWTTRSLAREMELSQTAVSRIWRAFGLQPHRRQVTDPSSDPAFVETLRDIVGLYLDRRVRAMVLCAEDSSGVQAPARAWPLAGAAGAVQRPVATVQRGTASLFAALDAAVGGLHGATQRRHGAVELLSFLRNVEVGVPQQLTLHLLVSDRGMHRTPLIKAWLERHPRFHVHWAPTPAAWLGQAERCHAALIDAYLAHGTYRSTRQLEQAMRHHLDGGRAVVGKFVWCKPAADTLASVERLRMKIHKSVS